MSNMDGFWRWYWQSLWGRNGKTDWLVTWLPIWGISSALGYCGGIILSRIL